ncbi:MULTISPECIES: DUF6248 family natural product biosynthesis protein [unclassified Streptomyces]|uniref:DUF6248 family natural product biosynthesis protein n=1 Tax=unclassified Streptomyces TaxID=2593676 RepID=UPI00074751CC|nr:MULTISPECIES: DUF6248 family natural product biosynthesis protein [unclassified Streptomyces]KUL73939.1 hypothetical protein ADL34_18935 [Streptomyces sp. NRRL WC-3605]KUL74344.1 hypothetical protein ADL33_17755 [Streptomyces sp. NRRL WC-3604]
MDESEPGEPTPQTCLRVAREAADLAAAADDHALTAMCRSSSRSEARLEEVMHAVHREAVEAEGCAARAERWAADPQMPGSALRHCARGAVDHAVRAQEAAGIEVTAAALRTELERQLTAQERAELESELRRAEAEREAVERAATGMDSDNRHLARMNAFLAESAVPALGWSAGHVRVMEAAETGRLYWRDGQARQAAERGVWSGGRRVHRERTQALHAAGFLTAAAAPDSVQVLTPTPMGKVALELARLHPAGLYDSDTAAYEARYARVAKRHKRMDDKKAAAHRLPALEYGAVGRYRRPVTLAEQEVRAEREATEQWEDEGGYCPGVPAPAPAVEGAVRCPCCGLRKATVAGVLAPHKPTRTAAEACPGSGLRPAAEASRAVPPDTAVRAEQPLLRRLFAPRAAREQRPARDVRTVIRRPQRVLTVEERKRVRDTAALNFQAALIMGIIDPVPNASPMPEEAGAWVREHVWPEHIQQIERKYPHGFARWSMCERGTCWNCLNGRCDICVHRQRGGPDVDRNQDWVTNHQGIAVARLILRPDGEPCVWWCRCACLKDGPAPARPAAKVKPAPGAPPATSAPARESAATSFRAPEAGTLQAALW